MKMSDKLCIDCKHFKFSDHNTDPKSDATDRYSKCTRKHSIRKSLVNGVVYDIPLNNKNLLYCDIERNHGLIESYLFGYCGRIGRYHERIS